jgi:D-glycero-alpha-D-manno-heptose-7-phosphate kinase
MIEYFNISDGLDIVYSGDLPAQSGVGSSSSFVVGLIAALYELKK